MGDQIAQPASNLEDPLNKRKPFVPVNLPSGGDGSQTAAPNNSFDGNVSMSLTPPPIASPIGSNASIRPDGHPANNASGDPAEWSRNAIAAQKPLIDAQTRAQDADTALKEQSLAGAKYDLQRKMNRRFQHGLGGGSVRTGVSRDMNGNVKPAGENALGERRIGADGKAIVSTPGLDASGLAKPVSSVDQAGNAVATATNPSAAIAARAQMSRASGGDGTTIGRVTDAGLMDKATNIANEVISKRMQDPQARANSIAGMPGVDSVSITQGNRTAIGTPTKSTDAPSIAAGVSDQINRGTTPAFKAPIVPNPAVPENRPTIAVTPAFTPPHIGPIASATPPAPKPSGPNPAADFLDEMDAKDAAQRRFAAGDAAARSGPGSGPLFQPVTIPEYKSPGAIPGEVTRMAGMGPANAPIPTAPKPQPLFPGRTRVASTPPVTQSATLPSGRPMGSEIVPPSRPASTVQKVPIRPRKVVQSAIVNPRVNPLFKPAGV